MDKTVSAVWHGWQDVARRADRLGHNASEMSDALPRDMYLEMCKGASIAAEISGYCQSASVEQVEALEAEKVDLLAGYFCSPDPRTPEQKSQDADAADYQATIASLLP